MRISSRVFGMAMLAAFSVPLSGQGKTTEIVGAADKFLATLTPEQRQKVLYAYDDTAQRARWSNFPTGVVKRGGINLKLMSAPQRDAAMKLMAVVLSPMGMEKVNEIRQADDDFKVNGSKRGGGGGGRGPGGPPLGGGSPGGGSPEGGSPGGGPPQGGSGGRMAFSSDDLFGSDLYYISMLGTPSTTAPWMLQFGGHHLALNITIEGATGVITPTLTGAQPAMFQANGKTIRPLAKESDKAAELLQSLDDGQKKQAVLSFNVSDLVLGPGQDGKRIVPEGLKVSAMNAKQQAMLIDVVAQWAGIVNDSYAAGRMAQIRAELKDTYFAWSGPTEVQVGSNITAYYRIQGPHLMIEYAPQNDEPNNHVHTMYRDPTNDYGSALAKR